MNNMRNLVLFVNMTLMCWHWFFLSKFDLILSACESVSVVCTDFYFTQVVVYYQVGLACKAGLNLVKPSNNKMARERDVCAANLSITMLFVPTETF